VSNLDDRPDPRRVPGPRAARKRRSAFARVFYSLFIAFALAGIAVFALGAYGYSNYIAPGPLAANKIYEIPKGLGAPEIGEALAKEGIISDANLFAGAALLTGKRGRLKAGEYEFQKQASIEDVLNLIASGKAITYKLTIPEGWTTHQALERIKANEILTGELTATPPEGGILPDTYVFKRGKTRDEIVAEMAAMRDKVVDELWRTRAPELPVASKDEALTLASIVEKETAVPEERPRIAGVFVNRLKKGMRLQSDPTIIYGITMGQGKLDRPLSRKDIDTKTAYNTYQIDGLPPGPIANPGRAALEAVLNPAPTDALYFVADGTGGHAFAATLEEHNANVVKWREIEKNRGQVELATAPPAEAAPAPVPDATAEQVPEPSTAPAATLPDVSELPEEVAPNGADAPAAPPAAAAPAAPAPETKPADTATTTPPTEPATAEAQPPEAEPKPFAEPPPPATAKVPLPPEKPEQLAEAEVTDGPKPGTVLRVAKRLVAIPVPKPVAP
jgi:UPF0755 protein